MEKLYKQFVESVIKLKTDEFFIARLKLTLFYSLTALTILIISSFILYKSLILNITESIDDNVVDQDVAHVVLDRTQDALQNRFIATDGMIMFFVIIAGFLLTKKTLTPIRESMQKQKRFIADASHELRTPITIAISGLEVAMRNKNMDINLAKDTISKTLQEMRELSKLTNHLLDLTKYNTGIKTENEFLQINDVISEIILKMRPMANEKGLEIKNNIKFQTTLSGNKIELGRVIYNVINNSITHTQKGGIISVSDVRNKKDYIISINDTGIGIPKDNLDKIFDPFYQGDMSRNTGGAGLGLTLAKQIIENHGGTIAVKSEVNKGTNVTITLPISS